MPVPQVALPGLGWPALVAGPVFLAFELAGKPPHKARHRSRIIYPKNRFQKPFIHNYPDPETEAHEKVLAQVAAFHMRGRPPTEKAVALLIHAFMPVPESWPIRDREKAVAGAIRPTARPDGDDFLEIVKDALTKVVYLHGSQIVDARAIKLYSDAPALRVEIREISGA